MSRQYRLFTARLFVALHQRYGPFDRELFGNERPCGDLASEAREKEERGIKRRRVLSLGGIVAHLRMRDTEARRARAREETAGQIPGGRMYPL